VFQMILLIVVSLILTAVGVSKAGGLMALYENTPKDFWNLLRPLDDPNYPWLAIVLGYPIMGVWFWCTDQSMVQSVLGAKSLKQGQLGANLTGWLKIFDVALFIIPGMACFVLFPDLKNPDEAYMTMVTRLFPAGMTGLVMAVLIAALVSTIDSALNSLSAVFTMDIYVKKYKPQASQKQIVKIGRIVTVAGAAMAIVLTLAIDSIKGLNLFDVFQAILGYNHVGDRATEIIDCYTARLFYFFHSYNGPSTGEGSHKTGYIGSHGYGYCYLGSIYIAYPTGRKFAKHE